MRVEEKPHRSSRDFAKTYQEINSVTKLRDEASVLSQSFPRVAWASSPCGSVLDERTTRKLKCDRPLGTSVALRQEALPSSRRETLTKLG
jgi:hypothetical protein